MGNRLEGENFQKSGYWTIHHMSKAGLRDKTLSFVMKPDTELRLSQVLGHFDLHVSVTSWRAYIERRGLELFPTCNTLVVLMPVTSLSYFLKVAHGKGNVCL